MKVFIENMGEIEFLSLNSKKWEKEKDLEFIKTIDSEEVRALLSNKYIESVLEIKDNEKYVMYECDPKILINPYRFDIFVKYIYVKSYVEQNDYEKAKEIYLDHIRAFNNFKEPDKSKNSSEDFIRDFNELIDKAKNNEFESFFVPVSNTGNIIDGSHRVAIALYFKQILKISLFDILDADYSYKFFENKNMNKEFIKYVVEYMPNIDSRLKEIISKEDIEEKILETGDIYYKEKLNDSYKYIISEYEV